MLLALGIPEYPSDVPLGVSLNIFISTIFYIHTYILTYNFIRIGTEALSLLSSSPRTYMKSYNCNDDQEVVIC